MTQRCLSISTLALGVLSYTVLGQEVTQGQKSASPPKKEVALTVSATEPTNIRITTQHPQAPQPATSCQDTKRKASCEDDLADIRRKQEAQRELAIARAFRKAGSYSDARLHLEKAIELSPDEDSAKLLTDTIALQRRQLNEETATALDEVRLRIERGEVDKALEAASKIKQGYGTYSQDKWGISADINRQLAEMLRDAHPIVWRAFLPWNGATAFWQTVAFLLLSVAIYALLLGVRKRGCYQNQPYPSTGRLVYWRVWSVIEQEAKGTAGAVMDALKLLNNPLLQPFKPPSLLLSPPLPFPDSTATQSAGSLSGSGPALEPSEEVSVWRDFLSAQRHPIGIELLPDAEMTRHEFLLEEAFDEMDVETPIGEAKGVISLIRNFRRWLYQGQPAAQAVVYKTGTKERPEWAVRLTCNWRANARPIADRAEVKDPGRGDTVSVYASTQQQESADAVALSAQRAALQLLYRLAVPGCTPFQLTAIAAFHQGARLLIIYL